MQHDNDLKRRAHIVTKWLDEKGVRRAQTAFILSRLESNRTHLG